VKKLLLLACAAWLLVALFAYAERARVGAKLSGASLPFKAAMLYLEPPDTTLAVPVEGVRAGQIKSSWQAPRSGGRLHEGQDIFAPRGTAVRSATAGYVVRVGENSLGGNTVFILGAGGRTYYYAHLDSYAPDATVGTYVTPQTVLGYVGTTGNATGTSPHLHFGVYTSSGAIDPLPLLQDAPS
jgi:murein DD-endopeptidase MepM/ murein hydrolase activator NlpD